MKLKQAEVELNARTRELAELMGQLTQTMASKDWMAFDDLAAKFEAMADRVTEAQQALLDAT